MSETRQRTVVKHIVRIALLGTIIGCFTQLWFITDEYLQKEVVTEIKIQTPRYMILPDVSFCTRLPFLLNFNRISSTFPEFQEAIQKRFPFVNSSAGYGELMKIRDGYKFVYKELTVRYNVLQISKIMFKPKDVFNGVHIISNKGFGYIPEEEMAERCEWKTYSREQDACYRLTCSKKGRYIYRVDDLKRSLFQDEVVEFELHQKAFSLIPNFKILLHAPNSYPRGQLITSVTIKSYPYATLNYIGYKRFKTNLLPPPYTTNCYDYKNEGYESRLHKIEECENELSFMKLGCAFNGNIHPMEMNVSHVYTQFYLNYRNGSFQTIVNEIDDKCSDIANQPDCEEEFFIPQAKLPRSWKGVFTLIMLNPPTEPDIVHVSKAKMPFTEYLVFIESTFGTWFGFCVITTLPQLCEFLFKSKPKVTSVKNVLKKQNTRLTLRTY